MNDPHVVALNYRIIHSDTIDYSNAKPLYLNECGFSLTVENDLARFAFKEHYSSEEQARESLAEYIRVWEFDAALKHENHDAFRLEFEKAEIIDRNPTPIPGHLDISFHGKMSGNLTVNPIVSVGRYPSPPSDIVLTPSVDTMYTRYMGYRQGREPLASMAYFCLTVLKNSVQNQNGIRETFAERYKVSNRVVKAMNRLSGSQGGSEARKAEGIGKDFNSQERKFLEQAVKMLIRRVAEMEHSPNKNHSEITLSDLPSLQNAPDRESKGVK